MDIKSLTIGELAKVEELAGQPFGHFGNEDKPQFKLTAALVYVLKKREDAKFTWQNALDMNTDELSAFLGTDEEDDEDPKEN